MDAVEIASADRSDVADGRRGTRGGGGGRRLRGDALRFLLVGPVGVALGGCQYELLWRAMPDVSIRGGLTQLLSAGIGVAWIHAIHCRFTFRGAPGAWRATIGGAYLVYSATIVLGATLMLAFVDVLGWQHNLSWVLATIVTSTVNFLFLRSLIPRPAREEP